MNALIKEIKSTFVEKGSLCIWWIGQEGYVFKLQDLNIYIDPYLSDFAERITKGKPNEHIRMTPAPMEPRDVTNADIVLCTHDHADHIDPDGIPVIAGQSPKAHFVVPECARQTMKGFGIAEERIHTLLGNDDLSLKGIRVFAIPARHEQFNEDTRKGFPFLSYIIEVNGITILHAGDTIPYKGQVEKVGKHRIDLAFVPINGRDDFRHKLKFEGNFTCEEAVEFALAINADLTVPMHYDMFTLNTADVREFTGIAKQRNLKHLVMKTGKPLRFPMEGEAPRGKPRGIFAEPCKAKNAIPPCGKPQGFLAKKG